MIRNRSFMVGLGCGLAAGALLLQLMISAGMATPTEAQVVREASKLNLKVSDAEAKLLTAEEWQTMEEQEKASKGEDEAGQANSGSSSQPAVTPALPAAPTKPAVGKTQNPAAMASPTTDTYSAKPAASSIALRIPRGVTLYQVSDLLARAGVIQDKEAFLLAARSRKAQTRIQYGLYRFEAGQSVDSIIDELVRVKE